VDETRGTLFTAHTKPLDERYPDWLAWSALVGICLLLAAVGFAIYTALIAQSVEWALVSACTLLASAFIWQFVLAKAEKLERRE
jgi:membrane protein YdbS with pleckstrin-like domain